ncbi:hypothetical protein BJX63DRAFT_431089 [Aspergillus granulosus]|uniref:Uncharacterized protein n=1 Tax=Aspergillus granulosus TaxID=176169 RepID=A0ABR4HHN7_9EURO
MPKHGTGTKTAREDPDVRAFWARVHQRSKKPPRKQYTAEQKRVAVELCRRATSLGIPVCTFAKEISICRISRRSWILADNGTVTQQITPTNELSAFTMTYLEDEKDDKPYDDEGRYLYFLNLSTRQLRQVFLKESEFYKLHTFEHPVPFVSLESGRRDRIRTFEEAYASLGARGRVPRHPGHPEPPAHGELPSVQTLLETHTLTAFTDNSQRHLEANMSVVDINKMLYQLAPDFYQRAPRNRAQRARHAPKPFYPEMEKCVALICHSLFLSSKNLVSVLPVRVELDYDVPYQGAPAQWAALLTFLDKSILLPLSLSLLGSQASRGYAPSLLYLQGWTIDHGLIHSRTVSERLRYYDLIRKSVEKFKHSPVLHIQDVEELFLHGAQLKGSNAIVEAAIDGHLEMLKHLLSKGADIDEVGIKGPAGDECYDDMGSPLHHAAKEGYTEMALFLIDVGANIHLKDPMGRTPEDLALKNNHTEILNALRRKMGAVKE